MKRNIVFVFLVAVATTVAHPFVGQGDSQENKNYFLYEDDNGQVQIERLDIEPKNLTASASDVIYYFFSKSNPQQGFPIHSNNIAALSRTTFSARKDTFFIIHGWRNTHESDVNSHIREFVLRDHDVNVFVVDWSPIAGQSYTSAQGSVRQVGQFVAAFARSLQTSFGVQLNNLKFVGHSLGAHVSGCAGAALNGQVDRIVGLDPAGPLFTDRNLDNRIHPGSAKFVQIIHTNGGLLGYMAPCGHSDYYPNGGKSQPGCGVDLTGSCAHSRAYAFYAESLTSNRFVSQRCESFADYTNNRCNGPISSMGMFNVDKGASGSYFLNVNSASPYARG